MAIIAALRVPVPRLMAIGSEQIIVGWRWRRLADLVREEQAQRDHADLALGRTVRAKNEAAAQRRGQRSRQPASPLS